MWVSMLGAIVDIIGGKKQFLGALGNVLGHGLGRARAGAGAIGRLIQHRIDDDPAAGVIDHVT